MSDFVKGLPDLIRAASTDWRSLIALVLLLAAAVIVALKVYRNKQLLAHLKEFPERDRLKAFEMELGTVKLRAGLSPEQWLRSRTNTYIFAGLMFACLLIAIIVLTLLAAGRPSGKVTAVASPVPDPIDANADQPPVPQTAANAMQAVRKATDTGPVSSAPLLKVGRIWCGLIKRENGMPAERIISYEASLENDRERLSYSAPYLDLQRRGGPIAGVNPLGSPFKWRYPLFGVKVANNSADTRILTQARITIQRSQVETEPILLIDDLSVNELVIRNEGWGPVLNPSLRISVSQSLAPGAIAMTAPEERTVPISAFDSVVRIPIEPPAYLKGETLVDVAGELGYDSKGTRRKLRFSTRVSLQVRPAAPPSGTREYEAFFKAGEAPKTILVDSLNEPIQARGYSYFFIRLGSDKTSHSRVRFEFQMDNREVIPAGEFDLDLFVPRTTEDTVLAKRRAACSD